MRYRRGRVLRSVPLAVAFAAGLMLPACKTLSKDGGLDAVAEITGKEVSAIRTPEEAERGRNRVAALLRRPLTADSAVQIALLNNRGLQAAYNELGIAEAVMVEASLPPSPTFSLQRISGTVEIEIERRIVANILALATLPARTEIAEQQFREAQLRAAQETLRLSAETRRAFYCAVAAAELAGFLNEAAATADATNELAKRLGESGAMNKLDQTREQVFRAEMSAQVERARQQAFSERERLVRALGLSGEHLALKMPGTLPSLPTRLRNLVTVEKQALAQRLDLQISRIDLDALAKSYGLTRATRFINMMDVSAVGRNTIDKLTGESIRDVGFEAALQIPLFDFGEVRVRKAEETYMQAVNRLVEMSVNARSEAREAYQAYRSAYAIAARYRNEVLPLRQIITDETTLRYNAMMIDVFGLLTEARQRITSRTASIEAQRDFWLATVDLDGALHAGGPGAGTQPAAMSAPANTPDQH